MRVSIKLLDHENEQHRAVVFELEDKATIRQLQNKIHLEFQIEPTKQEIFNQNKELIDVLRDSKELEAAGIKDGEFVILKHAMLERWVLYKKRIEAASKPCDDRVSQAKDAISDHKILLNSEFFTAYTKFDAFRQQFHYKVASWADGDVNLIREATEQYFRNLHDQRKGDEDSEFTCYFEERDADLGGRQTNTLAFIQLYGEDAVSKYNVKCHHYGPKATSSGQVPDISEFYCYKLLELIGVCPKSYIISPSTSTGTKTSTYIATQWDDKFELLENVIDENSLCVDVVVQLVMLRVLLFISDLYEQNCGKWRGTKCAAIVDFAPTNDFKIYPDIKGELITTFPHKGWKKNILL